MAQLEKRKVISVRGIIGVMTKFTITDDNTIYEELTYSENSVMTNQLQTHITQENLTEYSACITSISDPPLEDDGFDLNYREMNKQITDAKNKLP